MRDVLRRYQPNSIEDLTALNALYRPGPIQGGMIDDFIDRKHGRKKIEYELPELEEILKETLGVIVYQEQVMQIANRLAGYSLGEADLLRRAMGKKKAEEMAKQRERFVEGAAQRKFPAEEDRKDFRPDGAVRRIRLQQVALGGLCAACLSHGLSEDALSGRVHGGAADLGHRQHRRRGEVHQRVPRDGHCRRAARHQRLATPTSRRTASAIRFGLAAVKNVGHNAIESIVAARKKLARFKSIFEFCENVDLRLLNKRVLESLIKSGAMDSMGRRAQLMAVLDKAMEHAQKAQRDAESGQHGLFGVFQQERAAKRKARCPTFPTGTSTAPLRRKGNPRILHHRASAGEVQGQAGGLQALSDRRTCGTENFDRQRRDHRTTARHHQATCASRSRRRAISTRRAASKT